MSEVATRQTTEIARPLKVLVSLIKQDFEEAESAGKPFFVAAGEKLNEARDGHFQGQTRAFYAWAEKEFGKSRESIRRYMAATDVARHKPLKSLREFQRDRGYAHENLRNIKREWTGPVDEVAQRARQEAFRLAREDDLTRAQERDAERKLAHRLIDIGFKVLAKELHPDKMQGDREAMARLNRVRDKLKHSL